MIVFCVAMICQNPLYFAPNLNVCDVAKVPSQKKVTFLNRHCRKMHCMWASLAGKEPGKMSSLPTSSIL